MTKEKMFEAFDYILWQLKNGYVDLGCHDEDELETIAQAINKQIPKNPICKKYSDDTRCPICNTFVLHGNKHCIECGQALDWSEVL